MRNLLSLKFIPALATALLVLSKAPSLMKRKTRNMRVNDPRVGMLLSGPIVQKKVGEGYVYVLIRPTDGDLWLAAKSCDAKIGDTVKTTPARVVEAFESKELNLAFEKMYFGNIENT
jgi:hypothetical protein